jgi:hypothetical protein
VVAALTTTGYLGLVHIPRLDERIEALGGERGQLLGQIQGLEERLREATTWSGTVGYLFFSSTLRSEAVEHALTLRPGQPFVTLAVQPDLPRAAGVDDLLRFEIDAADGRSVWDEELSVGEVRQDLISFDVVLLQIPVELLKPGAYELRVTVVARPERGPLLQAPFTIQTAE